MYVFKRQVEVALHTRKGEWHVLVKRDKQYFQTRLPITDMAQKSHDSMILTQSL